MKTLNIQNKKAKFEYFILDTYIAGIQLTGTEIKSIRTGNAGLVDTFCTIDNNEIWLRNSYIGKFDKGSYNNHAVYRIRKLLLNKKEIKNLQKEVIKPGYSIVPLNMFINERGFCKVKIALVKGKHDYDKRQVIKDRDNKREIRQNKEKLLIYGTKRIII